MKLCQGEVVSLDAYRRQKKATLVLDVITHPHNIHILSRSGTTRKDIVVFAGTANVEQIWSGPRNYALVYFKNKKLYQRAQQVLCQRAWLQEEDSAVGYTLRDKWGTLETTQILPSYASHIIVTPWQWKDIPLCEIVKTLEEVLEVRIKYDTSIQTLSHGFLM